MIEDQVRDALKAQIDINGTLVVLRRKTRSTFNTATQKKTVTATTIGVKALASKNSVQVTQNKVEESWNLEYVPIDDSWKLQPGDEVQLFGRKFTVVPSKATGPASLRILNRITVER